MRDRKKKESETPFACSMDGCSFLVRSYREQPKMLISGGGVIFVTSIFFWNSGAYIIRHKREVHLKFDFPTVFSFKYMVPGTEVNQWNVKLYGSSKAKALWRNKVALQHHMRAAAADRAAIAANVAAANDVIDGEAGVIEPVEPLAGTSGSGRVLRPRTGWSY